MAHSFEQRVGILCCPAVPFLRRESFLCPAYSCSVPYLLVCYYLISAISVTRQTATSSQGLCLKFYSTCHCRCLLRILEYVPSLLTRRESNQHVLYSRLLLLTFIAAWFPLICCSLSFPPRPLFPRQLAHQHFHFVNELALTEQGIKLIHIKI